MKNKFYSISLFLFIAILSAGIVGSVFAQTSIIIEKDMDFQGRKALNVGEFRFSDNSTLTSAAGLSGAAAWSLSGNLLYPAVAGNFIGIGTTNPTSPLHVIGTSTITGVLQVGSGVASGASSAALYRPVFYDSDNNLYLIDPNNASTSATLAGNVGIGSTIPTQKLDVVGNGKFTGNITVTGDIVGSLGKIVQRNATGGSGSQQTELIGLSNGVLFIHHDNIAQPTGVTAMANFAALRTHPILSVNQGGSGPVAVFNGGNVGIGTISPNVPLYVVGTTTITGALQVGSGTAPASSAVAIYRTSFYDSDNTSYFIDPSNSVTAGVFAGKIGIGTTSPGYNLTVNGTAWVTSGSWSGSDARWKKNIVPLSSALDKVKKLTGVTFDWRQKEFSGMKFSSGKQIGFIAQDVEPIIPELVTTDANGYKGISYEKFVPVLVEAIKEQQKEIDFLKKEIEILKRR